MKRKFVLLFIVMMFGLTACGNQSLTPDYTFDKAMIKLADDTVITVDILNYHPSDNSVIINTKDGHKYGVAFTDVTFFNE